MKRMKLHRRPFFVVARAMTGMAEACVAQHSSGTVGSHRAAAACWRAARCLRWWNEPSVQETVLHAIGIVFENRKGTCSLLMCLFLWHDRRQALCLTVAGKKVLVVVWLWPFKGKHSRTAVDLSNKGFAFRETKMNTLPILHGFISTLCFFSVTWDLSYSWRLFTDSGFMPLSPCFIFSFVIKMTVLFVKAYFTMTKFQMTLWRHQQRLCKYRVNSCRNTNEFHFWLKYNSEITNNLIVAW